MNGISTFNILFTDITMIKDFINMVSKMSCDMDLVSGNRKYIVDAKSIMGILSLDLSVPVVLRMYSDAPEDVAKINEFLD